MPSNDSDSRKYADGLCSFDDFMTVSPALREVLAQGRLIAPSSRPALVRGETGCGKNLFVRSLHNASPRAAGPFFEVNLAGPQETLYSTLFGHERGAFTGAIARKVGAFQLADKGTLFLDEIGDLPLHLQPILLRACSQRTIVPLGGKQVRVDVRIVSATHRDLPRMVREGTFREDLYHRLAEIAVALPPLRERREDVILLLTHCLASIGRPELARPEAFEADAWAHLLSRPWNGNVRELKAVAFRIGTLAVGRKVRVADLDIDEAPRCSGAATPPAIEGVPEIVALDEMKRRYIAYAVQATGGNVTEAARRLDVSTGLIRRRLAEAK